MAIGSANVETSRLQLSFANYRRKLNLSLEISEASLSCDLFRDNVAKERLWPKYKSFFRNIYDILKKTIKSE